MGIESKIIICTANSGNYGAARRAEDIKYIVYHYTGNDGDTAKANASYYRDTVVKASAHYFVDDNEIIQSVGTLRVAWAVGGKKWADCAQTGGGTLYGVVTNANSISIEMCDVARDGQLMATEATLANAAALGRYLMERYNIPIENVVRHFDVTGKYCPAYFVDNAKWAAFKKRLTEPKQEAPKAETRHNSLADISAGAPWALGVVEALIERGAIKGGGVKDAFGRPADMDLSRDMLRMFVILDRAGALKDCCEIPQG